MNRRHLAVLLLSLFIGATLPSDGIARNRQTIKAYYFPLADHYAGIVAYEKYKDVMVHAAFTLEQMNNWDVVRALFLAGKADMAFIICPLAMDMFRKRPTFRFVSLLHRDGNALAMNRLLAKRVLGTSPPPRLERKPGPQLADAYTQLSKLFHHPTLCAVPHMKSTHTVVLYKYLKDHKKSLGMIWGREEDVVAVEVAPPRSPVYIKSFSHRGLPASFQQSLPWADVVETKGAGHVAWYSKDVMRWPHGHVECIAIATDRSIREKPEALREVIHYLHKAGADIERARAKGGAAMKEICDIVGKHIPAHTEAAVKQSLRLDLDVINYRHLNVDPGGLRQIMDYAVEGGILEAPINVEAFVESRFSTSLTNVEK